MAYVVTCVDVPSIVSNVPVMIRRDVSQFSNICTISILVSVVASKAGNYSVSMDAEVDEISRLI